MERKVKTGLFFLLLLGLSLIAVERASARDDWESWNTLKFKKAINKKVDLNISLEARFQDDMDEFYFGGIQIGPEFKINKYLNISPSYFWVNSKAKGHFQDEHRYILDGINKLKISVFKLENRLRLEYRDLRSLERFRYRYRFKIGLPTKFFNRSVTPYISEEIFYEERINEFNQNRFSTGVSLNIIKGVDFDIYYLLRSDRTGRDWSERNVLGTSLSFSF